MAAADRRAAPAWSAAATRMTTPTASVRCNVRVHKNTGASAGPKSSTRSGTPIRASPPQRPIAAPTPMANGSGAPRSQANPTAANINATASMQPRTTNDVQTGAPVTLTTPAASKL